MELHLPQVLLGFPFLHHHFIVHLAFFNPQARSQSGALCLLFPYDHAPHHHLILHPHLLYLLHLPHHSLNFHFRCLPNQSGVQHLYLPSALRLPHQLRHLHLKSHFTVPFNCTSSAVTASTASTAFLIAHHLSHLLRLLLLPSPPLHSNLHLDRHHHQQNLIPCLDQEQHLWMGSTL